MMLLILNLPLVGIFAKIVRVAPKNLMPTVVVLCVVGATATTPISSTAG